MLLCKNMKMKLMTTINKKYILKLFMKIKILELK